MYGQLDNAKSIPFVFKWREKNFEKVVFNFDIVVIYVFFSTFFQSDQNEIVFPPDLEVINGGS
jgi:hypothetical protein